MVKLKDIAEKCGLSIASVSKALSGKSDIDKFEYGYESTLVIMAKMEINKVRL